MKFNHSGFLNINKPPNITSHDVISALRKQLKIKTIGHSGTLDPFAEGVLAVGINHATRLLEYIPSDKVYVAEILFGTDTDTNDITGAILKKDEKNFSLNEIKCVLNKFQGKISQKPPIYSALKIHGKKSYALARKGQISLNEIKSREVEIYNLEILSFFERKLRLQIHCSSGTYIRSIARDLGIGLGSCAALSSLMRIKIGEYFTLEKSIPLNQVLENNVESLLIKPCEVVNLKKIYLNDIDVDNIFHGKSIKLEYNSEGTFVQALDNEENIVCIGVLEGNALKPKKVFHNYERKR